MIRRCWRFLRYALLGLLLVVLLLSLPVFLVLRSEAGSRWLIGQALGVQRELTLQVAGGNLVDGLDLRDIHFRGRKFDLYIHSLLVRWSLASLLAGHVRVDDLEAEQTLLVLHGPPHTTRTHLLTLPLPLPLDLVHGDLHTAGIEEDGHYRGLDHLTLNHARWELTTVTLPDAVASAAAGRLSLHGAIHLRDEYPLQATGLLELAEFDRQGLQPLRVRGSGDLGHLHLELRSEGRLVAGAAGVIDTLVPGLAYQAHGEWKAFHLPWLPTQDLSTRGGELSVHGNLVAMHLSGHASLAGRHVPAGDYTLKAGTDWHGALVEALDFRGLGGSAGASGKLDWRQGFGWQLQARLRQVNLARQWPLPPGVLPALTGTLVSQGRVAAGGSSLSAVADLAGGEHWQASLQSGRRPWDPGAIQQLDLSWSGLARQLPWLGATSSTAGELKASGTSSSYRVSGDFQLQSARLPTGSWHVDATGAGSALAISQLDYDGSAGAASFSGTLRPGRHPSWDGLLLANGLQTGWLLPDWAGTFSGSVATSGSWAAGAHQVTLSRTHLTGSLHDRPLSVDGAAEFSLPAAGGLPEFSLHDLELVWGDDQLYAGGGLTQQWALRVDAKLHDLALIDPGLGGRLDAQLNLTGAAQEPSGRLHVDGLDVSAGSLGADRVQLDADLARLGQDPGSVSVTATGLTVGRTELDQLAISASGSRDHHELQWQVSGAMGSAQGRLTGHYDTVAQAWSGREEQGEVHLGGMDWRQEVAASLGFDLASRTLRVGAHCWSSDQARLCNDEDLVLGPAGHGRVHLSNLDATRLQPYLPAGLSLEGRVSGDAQASWEAGELPQATANLLTQDGAVVLGREEGQAPLRLSYQLVTLQAFLQQDDWRLRFDLLSTDLGNGYADVHVNPRDPAHPLSGDTSLQGLQLEIFRPFFPALATLSGQAALSGQLGGVLRHPAIVGQLAISGGRLVARDAPINLSDVGLTADIQGDQLQLKGQARSGSGVAQLSGEAGWGDQPHLNLKLSGHDFEVSQPPTFTAPVDPDLRIAVVPGQVGITGRVLVHNARINLKTLAENATPLSPDVVVVDADDKSARAQLSTVMKNWQVNADIDLVLGDLVSFHGFGVSALLSGDIRLQQQGRRGLQGTGEVELDKNARYDAYGQKLQITQGRIIFAGPLTQPAIDVEASKQVENMTVGIRVTGRANAPEVSFFSDSDLSQGDILSYLLVGRPLYQNGQFSALGGTTASSTGGTGTASPPVATAQQLALATAAIKLTSTGGGEDLANRIGGVFGFSDIAIGAEQTADDTQFTVSGYVNPRLYLSYGVGVFTPVNTKKIRFNITSHLYLEAVSAIENALDLYYNFKF